MVQLSTAKPYHSRLQVAGAGGVMTDLLKRVATDRDQAAFDALFREYGPRIKSMMMRRGADAATADELAQETLLTVWRKAHLFVDSKGSAASWMFTIARNLRIDRIRREFVWQELDESVLEQPSDELSPEEQIDQQQQHDRLGALMTGLPDEQRVILEMSFRDGLSQNEIASALGLPLGTVKSRMRLAYQKLRTAFGDDR